MALQLEFRHDCQNLGCANTQCNLCKLSQRRRCPTNFAGKYLAPCDVVEAKCGAQIYVVVVEEATGQLVQQGLEDLAILISIIDGRKFDAEGEGVDGIERCELLTNKQGQPLLAHGRSGSYTDTKRVLVPMIHGQALLPDLKITDSSEALLTGRAPPFRLSVRAVHRNGEPFEGVGYALSEPFVVATARVKGAAKLDIPHVDDHVSKIDCVGLQTQKKLEDIRAAAVAAGVPDLNLPINSVVKVGQFRDLVETAERNKALRETLKQVLRLTKGWDVARDHVRKAVETDVQLRVYHPDGRTEVGLVFKCGSFNVIDINRPVGLMRRKQNPQQANQELVDVIWLPLDTASFPDAVKRMLPQASADWRKDAHPGWALLPLTTAHMPPYSEGGKPTTQTSSFTFTVRMAGGAPPPGATSSGGPAPMDMRSPRAGTPPAGLGGLMGGGGGGMNGFAPPPAANGGLGGYGLGGLGGLGLLPQQQQLPSGFVPGGGGGLDPLRGLQQPGLSALQGGTPGLPPDLLFGGQQQALQPPRQQQQQYGGLAGLHGLGAGDLANLGLDASALQGLMQMPTLDLFPSGAPGGGGGGQLGAAMQAAAAAAGGQLPVPQQQQQQQQQQQLRGLGGTLPPELAGFLKEDSMSPFEDANFQQLMSMMAANGPPEGPRGTGGSAPPSGAAPLSGRGPAPRSGGSQREKLGSAKRKADTSLETWMNMNKTLDEPTGMSLPPSSAGGGVAPLESLFTSMLPGGEEPGNGGPAPPPVGFFPAMPSGHDGSDGGGVGGADAQPPASRGGEAAPATSDSVAGGTQQEPAFSGARPMEVQQASEASRQRPAATAEPAPPAGAPAAALAPAPAPLVRNVTLEDMQQQFARAMRQEISFAELEEYLKRYNLLPSGQPINPAEQQQQASPAGGAAGVKIKDGSGGLEDMQTIEMALPR